MGQWRKRPVVVEAEIYQPGLEDRFEQACSKLDTCSHNATGENNFLCADCDNAEWILKPYIQTLEGKHYITEGDYIITGVAGERYPCKPDIFLATYEKV